MLARRRVENKTAISLGQLKGGAGVTRRRTQWLCTGSGAQSHIQGITYRYSASYIQSKLEWPVNNLFSEIRISLIRSLGYSNIRIYSNITNPSKGIKMRHIEAKSIKDSPRYEPKFIKDSPRYQSKCNCPACGWYLRQSSMDFASLWLLLSPKYVKICYSNNLL